jgi:hypothetical protein
MKFVKSGWNMLSAVGGRWRFGTARAARLVTLVLVWPVVVQAQYTYTGTYIYLNNGSLSSATIAGYTGAPTLPSGAITIPSMLYENPVTSIGDYAFYNCTNLTNVLFPNGNVTNIGYEAFYGCAGLTTIKGYGVMNIEASAFQGCTSLTNVLFLNGATTIGTSAFQGCTSLTTMSIPNGVTIIGDDIFYGCTSLASVTIPNGVTNIGDSAFYGCSSLTNVTIPNSVTSIGDNAFWGCNRLTNVTIPNSVTAIGDSAFYNCASLTNVTIPDSITSIGFRTFNWCSGLTSVTIGSNVTNIGEEAFWGCTSLTSVTIPDSVTSIGAWAFEECFTLTNVTIPNSVTNIAAYAFDQCTSLTSVTIPASVNSIGEGMFYGCTSLTNMTIPDSVNSIGDEAFEYCKNLTSVTIGSNVTSIEYWAFYGCTSLTTVTIPNSVTNIGEGAFWACISLAKVTIPNGVTTICNGTFQTCEGLTNVTIPNSVTSIAANAFQGCASLTCVTIPNSVTNIAAYAFQGCASLSSIYFRGNASSLGGQVFLDDPATVYYLLGTTGWTNPWGGLPTVALSTVVTNTVKLIVASAYGGASPGTVSTNASSIVTETIINSPLLNGTTQYVCTGGTVVGNDFTQVSPTNVTLTMTNDATLTWNWQTQYLLTTATNGSGRVTSGGWYVAGSNAVLTATAGTNAHFIGWNGDTNDCGLEGYSITAPMSQARLITALFAITTNKTLTVVSAQGGTSPGTTVAYDGTVLSEHVTNSPVVNGTTQYVCTGATMNGNTFTLVNPTNVTLSLTNNATLTWLWSTNYWLAIATNGNGSMNPPSDWWPKGSNAQIIATAGDHALFGTWSGQTTGCTIKSNVITAPMTAARAITANFVRAIIVTATANPTNGGTVTGSGVYLANTNTITLVAKVNTGWRFTGWSDGTTTATHATLKNLASDTNYTANFVQFGTVTTKANPPTGGTVTGGGTYDVGTVTTLVAKAATSWLFTQWENSNTNANRQITVAAGSVTCTATFVQGRILTVKASPANGGTVTGGGSYTTNTWATITATSSNNWRFAKWNDSNTNATRQVLVTAAVTYTATFIQQGTLVVQAVPPAGGTATGSGVYDVNSTPTLRATTSRGWRFGKWSDGNTTTSRTMTVTAGTHTNNATFIQQTVITAVASPIDGGTVTGSGTYDTNAVVTLTAKAASANWKFQGWADTNSATSPRSVRASVGGATYTGLFVIVTGEIALSTNALAFGPVPVGQSATQTVAVTNLGPNAVKVSSITVPTGYTAKPTAFTLASNGMTNVTVVFKPTLAAAQTGTVTLVSNAARGAAKVAVNGTGLTATRVVLLTGPLSFGTVKEGTTSNLTLTVADNGNSPMIVTALKFSGTGYAQFTLPGLKVPFTVAAGGSTNLTAAFTPTAATTNRATLTATVTSMTTGSTNTLTATGIGVAPVPGAVVKATTGVIVPNGVSTNTPEGFAQWALLHGLAGNPADLFDQRNGNGITYGAQYTFGANLAPGEPLMRLLVVNGVLTAEVPLQDPATLLDTRATVEFTRYEGSAIWFPAVCLPPYAITPLTKQWFQSGYGDAADFQVNVRLVK